MTARINSISADVDHHRRLWTLNFSEGLYGKAMPNDAVPHGLKIGLVHILFLFSVILVPLDLKLIASFTLYDMFVMLIAALLVASGGKKLEMSPVEFQMAIYLFLLFTLLSAFRATYPLEALTQTLQFCFIFFIQLPVILTVVKSSALLRLSLLLLAVGTVLVTGWAMVFQEEGAHHRLRTFSSDNSNRLGYPAAYMMPFLLYLFGEYWRRKRFLILGFIMIVVCMMLWALSASGSRSAAAGTLLGLMIFLTFRHGINFRAILRAFGSVTIIGVFGYLFYQSEYSGILRERIDRTLQSDDSLISDRVRLAKAGWRAFQESPLLGVGLDNFQYVSKRFDVPMVTAQAPHNLWLQFLAQVGLIGTLAFFVVIVCWFLWLLWAQRVAKTQPRRDVLWAFIASMTALMGIFMLVPVMIDRLYWFIYGLGLATVFSIRDRPTIRIANTQEVTKVFDK